MMASNDISRRAARLGAVAALGGLALTLAACSAPTRPTAIVAPATKTTLVDPHSPIYKSIVIGGVTGGERTTLISNSKVSDESFREALTTSLRLNALLSDQTDDDYIVFAEIQKVEQPVLQINFTTHASVSYRVVATKGGAELYAQTVDSSSEATLGDTIIRQERIRIATEGAMRENIGIFLNDFVDSVKSNPYPYNIAADGR